MARSRSAWGMACVMTAVFAAGCARAPKAPDNSTEASDSFAILRLDHHDRIPAGQPVVIDNPYGNVRARFGGFEHDVDSHALLQEPNGPAHAELRSTAKPRGSANNTNESYTVNPSSELLNRWGSRA